MAETLKIEIEMSQSGTGGEDSGVGKAGIKNEQSKTNAKAFWTYNRAVSVAKQFGNQVVNGAVGQIGLNTGNYVLEQRIQKGMNVAQKIAGIGMAFAVNPWLGGLALVSEGIGAAFSIHAQIKEIEWQNRSASELARRAGYLSNKNR